jgi:hypothetical protein
LQRWDWIHLASHIRRGTVTRQSDRVIRGEAVSDRINQWYGLIGVRQRKWRGKGSFRIEKTSRTHLL